MKLKVTIFILITAVLFSQVRLSDKDRVRITSGSNTLAGVRGDSIFLFSLDTISDFIAVGDSIQAVEARSSVTASNLISDSLGQSQVTIPNVLNLGKYIRLSNTETGIYDWSIGLIDNTEDYRIMVNNDSAFVVNHTTFDINTYANMIVGGSVTAGDDISGEKVYERYGSVSFNNLNFRDEWVRFAIAENYSHMNYGLFQLSWNGDYTSDPYERQNGAILFTATADKDSIGQVQINLLHSTTREQTTIGVPYIRAVTNYGVSEEDCYLEYYVGTNDESSVDVYLTNSTGWELLDTFIKGSVPVGYDSLIVSTQDQFSYNNVNGSTSLDRNHNLQVDGDLEAKTLTLTDTTKSQLLFKNPSTNKVRGSMFTMHDIGGYDGIEISNAYHNGTDWYLEQHPKPLCTFTNISEGNWGWWTGNYGLGAVTGWNEVAKIDTLGNMQIDGDMTTGSSQSLNLSRHKNPVAKFYRDSAFTFTSAMVWETIPFKDVHDGLNTEHFAYNADSTGIVNVGFNMKMENNTHLFTEWTGGDNDTEEIRFRIVKGVNGGSRIYTRCGQSTTIRARRTGDINTATLCSVIGFALGDTLFVQGEVSSTDYIIAPDYNFGNPTTGAILLKYNSDY